MQTLTKNKYLSDADFEKFKRVIKEMLKENPNDSTLIEIRDAIGLEPAATKTKALI